MKLLIVDDVRSFLDLETTFLRRADCQVLTASTGLEAIRVARDAQPDVIVLDVEMPEMNGIEATRILKANPALSRIPVIICSSTQREAESMAAGAQEFVHKPIDEERFLAVVQRHVPLKVRSEPRRGLDAPCRFTKDGVFHDARIGDVSVSGLFLETRALLAIGDDLSLAFQLPLSGGHKEINAEGLVVRAAEGGYGLGFRLISEGDRWLVQEFVAAAAED